MRKFMIGAVLVTTAFAAPSFASEHFFVAMGADKKCQVTSEQPDGKTMQNLTKNAFKTKDQAEAAMKQMPACSGK